MDDAFAKRTCNMECNHTTIVKSKMFNNLRKIAVDQNPEEQKPDSEQPNAQQQPRKSPQRRGFHPSAHKKTTISNSITTTTTTTTSAIPLHEVKERIHQHRQRQQEDNHVNGDDDNGEEGWSEWGASEEEEPKPRNLLPSSPAEFTARELSIAPQQSRAGAAAAASIGAACGLRLGALGGGGGGLNLRTAKALSEKTNQLHERREQTLRHSPMNRIVFIQRVCLFASSSIKRAAEISYVSDSWSECVRVYNDNFLWRNIVKKNFLVRDQTRFDAIRREEEFDTEYLKQRGHAPPPPPVLSSEDVGVKTLFALCSGMHDIPWLVECLVAPNKGSIEPNIDNSRSDNGGLCWTALAFAVAGGLKGTVDVLLANGACVTSRCLDLAISNRRLAIFDKLIAAAKQAETLHRVLQVPSAAPAARAAASAAISQTVTTNNVGGVESFLDKMNPVHTTPVPPATHRAAQEGTLEGCAILDALEKILSRDEMCEMLVASGDAGGNTALHMACREHRKPTTEWLLAFGERHKLDLIGRKNAAGKMPFELGAL